MARGSLWRAAIGTFLAACMAASGGMGCSGGGAASGTGDAAVSGPTGGTQDAANAGVPGVDGFLPPFGGDAPINGDIGGHKDATAHGNADGLGPPGDGGAADGGGPGGDASSGPWTPCAQPGGWGCPCATGDDCLSSFCVDSIDGPVCSVVCGECPPGWTCAQVAGAGPDTFFVCTDPLAHLCEPCTGDEQCPGGQCVSYGDALGSFCGVPCSGDGDCPTGFHCAEVGQCVSDEGDCTCTGMAVADGAATLCHFTDEVGTCEGTRRCTEAGPLPPCDAPHPAAETCNGVDDDCDGLTDEPPDACGPNRACACKDGACACGCAPGFVACGEDCADLQSDVAHCGSCENACTAPGVAVAQCAGGQCAVVTCEAGKVDLDADFSTGCECEVSEEICNGKDDDCDGQTDEQPEAACPGGGDCIAGQCACPEGLLWCDGACVDVSTSMQHCGACDNPCTVQWPGVGTASCEGGECKPGPCLPGWFDTDPTQPGCECNKTGVVETCNGIDDDCDGQTDEEPVTGCGPLQLCTGGQCVCDPSLAGLLQCGQDCVDALSDVHHCGTCDTDCTALPWPNVAAFACDGGQCVIQQCAGNYKDVDGVAETGCECEKTGALEVCDGADNDCDGQTDEGVPGVGESCETGLGSGCAAGTRVCQDGVLACVPLVEPTEETCNGVDDDCDGQTDEALPGAGEPCDVPGALGVCAAGTMQCTGGQWGCEPVAPPSDEVCNGLDDDCDGQTDEDDPALGDACTVSGAKGVCANGERACEDGKLVCAQTVFASPEVCNGLDDDCDGAPDSPDPAQVGQDCQVPGQLGVCANGRWACTAGNLVCEQIHAPTAETCNGLDDDCDGQTDEGLCDDGLACTTDICAPGGACTFAVQSGWCVIDGACVAAGTKQPGNPCRWCDPASDPHAWVPSVGQGCDDGDPCTVDDACTVGGCAGKPLDCSPYVDACNDAACIGGVCIKQPHGGACSDGDPCTTADACVGGQCVGQPKDCSWKGDACNQGVCQGGSCVKVPKNGACDDGNPCTVSDACNGGVCVGQPKDCSYLDDACHQGVCQTGSCVKQAKAGPCNDGDPCTTGDTCINGWCQGTLKNCSYLDDACNMGICQGGSCVAQPTSGPCDDGDPCTTGDTCLGGQCVGNAPPDDAPDGWVGLHITDITDCANLDYSLQGALYPAGDDDWYYFKVSDTTGCDVQPKVVLEVPAGADYDLCAYFECSNGNTADMNCLEGSLTTGPNGEPGCCSQSGGSATESVRLSPSCSTWGTGDDGGYVDIEVRHFSGNTCANYVLKWGDS